MLLSTAAVPQRLLQSEAEETTEKYGLEAGLFKVATGKAADGRSKTQQVRLC